MIGFSFKECKILQNISFGIYGDIGGGISERGTLDFGLLGEDNFEGICEIWNTGLEMTMVVLTEI